MYMYMYMQVSCACMQYSTPYEEVEVGHTHDMTAREVVTLQEQQQHEWRGIHWEGIEENTSC